MVNLLKQMDLIKYMVTAARKNNGSDDTEEVQEEVSKATDF